MACTHIESHHNLRLPCDWPLDDPFCSKLSDHWIEHHFLNHQKCSNCLSTFNVLHNNFQKEIMKQHYQECLQKCINNTNGRLNHCNSILPSISQRQLPQNRSTISNGLPITSNVIPCSTPIQQQSNANATIHSASPRKAHTNVQHYCVAPNFSSPLCDLQRSRESDSNKVALDLSKYSPHSTTYQVNRKWSSKLPSRHSFQIIVII